MWRCEVLSITHQINEVSLKPSKLSLDYDAIVLQVAIRGFWNKSSPILAFFLLSASFYRKNEPFRLDFELIKFDTWVFYDNFKQKMFAKFSC